LSTLVDIVAALGFKLSLTAVGEGMR